MWAAPVLNWGDSFYYGLLLVSTSDISDIIFGRLVVHVGVGCWLLVVCTDIDAYTYVYALM